MLCNHFMAAKNLQMQASFLTIILTDLYLISDQEKCFMKCNNGLSLLELFLRLDKSEKLSQAFNMFKLLQSLTILHAAFSCLEEDTKLWAIYKYLRSFSTLSLVSIMKGQWQLAKIKKKLQGEHFSISHSTKDFGKYSNRINLQVKRKLKKERGKLRKNDEYENRIKSFILVI